MVLCPIPLSKARVALGLRDLWSGLGNILLPAGCRLCEELLEGANRLPVCDACLQSFQRLSSNVCQVCGQPWSLSDEQPQQDAICRECRQFRYTFQLARSFGVYEGNLARAVVLLKLDPIEPLARWFADRLAEMVRGDWQHLGADLIIPVPLHQGRKKERGFNQVELFAKPLARSLRLPYRRDLLVRTKARPDKLLMGFQERWDAVRGAFAVHYSPQVDNLRILLLDDVMTTGATLNACSVALREAGASSVVGLTVARAMRPSLPAIP